MLDLGKNKCSEIDSVTLPPLDRTMGFPGRAATTLDTAAMAAGMTGQNDYHSRLR